MSDLYTAVWISVPHSWTHSACLCATYLQSWALCLLAFLTSLVSVSWPFFALFWAMDRYVMLWSTAASLQDSVTIGHLCHSPNGMHTWLEKYSNWLIPFDMAASLDLGL
jgi:hypothetical protein